MPSTGLSPSKLHRRWQTADSEERRRLIVAAAIDLLSQRRRNGVTMRRVAHRLGIGTMTLYTYIESQAVLYREMTCRGFELLDEICHRHSTLGAQAKWRGGARAYLQFAMDNPNLYSLMFDVPIATGPDGREDEQILRGGCQSLVDKVLAEMAQQGLRGPQLQARAYEAAGRFWFALHGLASLLIAGRTSIFNRDVDELLDDLIEHVAPT